MSYLDLKRLLSDKKLNQIQLSELTGINQSYLSMLSSRKRKLSDLMRENLELKVGDVSDYLIVDVSNVDSVDYKIPLKSKRSASISVPIDFEEDDIDSIVMWLDLLRGGI